MSDSKETELEEVLTELPRSETKHDHSKKYKHEHVEKVRHSDGTEWFYFMPLESEGTLDKKFAEQRSVEEQKYPAISGGDLTTDEVLPATVIGRQRLNRRTVFWECKLKRISDINTSTETFRCRLHYYLTWLSSRNEKLHWDKYQENQRLELQMSGFYRAKEVWTPEWVPNIELSNAVTVNQHSLADKGYEIKSSQNSAGFASSWEAEDTEMQRILGFDPLKAHWIRAQFECDVEFAEELELEAFPFDVQDFTMYFKSAETADRCVLLPMPRNSKFCALDTQFSVLNEWELEKLMVEFRNTSSSMSRSGRVYSLISIHVKATRKWRAQLGNLGLTFGLFALGLVTFANDASDGLGERLGFVITLMLADVASLQYLEGQLPQSPTFTWMDKYMYSCFGYLFLVTAWSGFVGLNGGMKRVDYFGRWAALALYVLVHLYFLYTAVQTKKLERSTLDKTDEELEEFNEQKRHITKKTKTFSIPFSAYALTSQSRKHAMVWKSQDYSRSRRGNNFIGQIAALHNNALRFYEDTVRDV